LETLEIIHAYSQIKLLADTRRLDILRLLMVAPATLTQLAQTLKQSPAWVRHHILALESADLVEIVEIRKTGRVTEKYYQAKAGAILFQQLISQKTKKPSLIFSGSNDPAMITLAQHIDKRFKFLNIPVSSLDGLIYLRLGLCQFSGTHILDEDGEYNVSTVRHLFPDREMMMVTLAHRMQGLILAKGNPKSIRKIRDIAQPHIHFVNRDTGSGTRLWFDAELKRLRIDPKQIKGYDMAVKTHNESAEAIETGQADVALGLQAAAFDHQLDFIPLHEERYDLVLPRENEKLVSPFLSYLKTAAYRKDLNSLPGYNSAHSGEQIPL